jgi:glucose/arabinose dehydrogenase
MKKIGIVIFLGALLLGAVVFFFKAKIIQLLFMPTKSQLSQGLTTQQLVSSSISSSPSVNAQPTAQLETVAEKLEIPWEISFLPDKSLLVTQRPGKLVRIMPSDKKVITVQDVTQKGEGGLLGLALHPQFATNHWLYLYHTTQTATGLFNTVERFTFDISNNTLSEKKIIIDNIPASTFHDGGRIAFGPDHMLYITTGDAEHQDNAQDTNSVSGKILRLNDDGSIPADNPFHNPVYSYGHRNPQGLAWDSEGNLWETEHGPSGTDTGNDEVNLIEKGGNYGWPVIKGTQTHRGMIPPVIESGKSETWAPAGAEIFRNTLFFTGLRGESLYAASIQGKQLGKLIAHFQKEFGRLRIVKLDPDQQWLYLATSNTDGRGKAQPGDDKIMRVRADLFFTQ